MAHRVRRLIPCEPLLFYNFLISRQNTQNTEQNTDTGTERNEHMYPLPAEHMTLTFIQKNW